MKLYVGNLPWSINDDSLRDLFSAHGTVESATVVMDRDSGRSRGFGFVEMDQTSAQRAMSELNGHSIESRELRVNEANDRPKRSDRY
jgi:RNA recognition motif-containing protein